MTEAQKDNPKVNFKRVMLAFIFAPPLSCFIFSTIMLLSAGLRIIFEIDKILIIVSIGLLYAYPAMLFFGFITIILFDYNNIRGVFPYVFSGFLAGTVTVFISFINAGTDLADTLTIIFIFFGGIAGSLCSTISWIFMTYKRAD